MRLYSKNEYAEAWIGAQKEPWVMHSKQLVDSRAALSMDLLKCAVEAGGHDKWGLAELAAGMCDLSEAMHKEWRKREWTIPTPPMGEEEDKTVGIRGAGG